MNDLVIKRWRNNMKGFWLDYRWFILLFVAGILADSISTVNFMRFTGPEAELHPGVYYCSIYLGPYWGPMVAGFVKIFAGFGVAVYLRRHAPVIFMSVAIISFLACLYNFSTNPPSDLVAWLP